MDHSRASTVTLGYDDFVAPPEPNAGRGPTEISDGVLGDLDSGILPKRLIVAIDFGTTYSAVSYVALEEGELAPYLDLDRICSIQNFPDDWNLPGKGDQMKCEVPTEVIYPLDRNFREKEDLVDVDEEEEQIEDDANIDSFGSDNFNYGDLAVFGRRNDDTDDSMSIDDPSSFRWGYGVHEAWNLPSTHSNPKNQALSRFKLLLDSSDRTKAVRDRLNETLDELKRKGVTKNSHDVIVDFLTCLLRHTKSELRSAGFDESYRMEIVLCVPAIWQQKACRDMQTALAKAMQRAKFKGVDIENNSIEGLFIVSEPEAAAAYVLATERQVSPGDTFVLLDAGGGTVDANTYTVSATTPLRLGREVVRPGGGLCGSSYLNEAFRKLLKDRLAGEDYLEQGELTRDGIIEKIMINFFEYRLKRTFNCYGAIGRKEVDVPGLRDNPAKGFRRGMMSISVREIQQIFLARLQEIAAIMETQIKAARSKGVHVDKVLLIGGFAASISLRTFLQDRLKEFCRENGGRIAFISRGDIPTAVASGAVLRASNKRQGPQRVARSSYGVLRTEPFGDFDEHGGVTPSYDRHDGLPYVVDTIDWVLKLGDEVDPVWTCLPFQCSHTFNCGPNIRLVCEEVLYVSDRATKSHYQLKHPNNEGAEMVGKIVVDFTFLREEGLIRPVMGGMNSKGKRVGKKHYKVTYDMAIRVVDRDLQCYAIYDNQVMKRCRLNIASAFGAGVK